MAFQEKLEVLIESTFDSSGLKRLQAEIGKTKAQMATMLEGLDRAEAFSNIRNRAEQAKEVFREAGLEASNLNNRLAKGVDNAEAMQRLADAKERITRGTPLRESFGRLDSPMQMLQQGFDPEKFSALGNSISGATSELQVLQSTGKKMNISDMILADQPQMNVPEFLPQDPMEQFEQSSNMQSIFGQRDMLGGAGAANRPERFMPESGGRMTRFLSTIGMSQDKIDSLRGTVGRTGAKMSNFKARTLKGLSGGFGRVAGAAQGLQMRLLGLQFTMLTVAFIFGGLMAGALGAVGVFQVLGSTLRFMFLPTALNVLDVMLDLQSFVFNMNRDTRELIGNIFAWISVFAILGGIAAALLKPIVTLIGGIAKLGAVLSKIGPGGAIGGLKFLAGILKTIGSVIAGSIGAILSFIGGLAAGFLAVVTVAERFGKKVALVFGTVLAVVGAVVAAIVSAPALVVAAIGVAIGAILGLIWTFRDTFVSIMVGLVDIIIRTFFNLVGGIWKVIKGIINIIQGLVTAIVGFIVGIFTGNFQKMMQGIKEFVKGVGQIFWGLVDLILAPFKAIFNAIIGNSIIPEMVNGIIDFLFKLPGKAFDMAESLVQNIINGIKGVGNGIWNALKSVLPGFLVDALEKGGKAIGGLVDSAGNVIGKGGKMIGDVASGIGSATSKLADGVTSAASDFASGVGSTVDNFFGGGDNQSSQTVNNNDVTVNADMRRSESTPQEEEERLSRIVSQGTNNETGDRSGGR